MNRMVNNKNILDVVCTKFCKILEKHCKYIAVSGFVAISSGRTRGTEDIDIIIENVPYITFDFLHKDLIKKGFICMQGDKSLALYQDYLKNNISIRYTYKNLILPEMELKIAKDELDEYQLQNRTKLKLTGIDVWFGSVNYNIAFKEELLKSDKDIEDAKHLRIVYSNLINEVEIYKIKKIIRRLRL